MKRRSFLAKSIWITGSLGTAFQIKGDMISNVYEDPRVIEEPSRSIPIYTTTDIVVCGGGPAGFIAAIAAARTGAKVLLIEKYGFLGGMATAGMVGPLSKFNLNGERIVDGIPGEFIREMHKINGAIIDLPSGNIPYDVEAYKITAQRLVITAGVEILLHAKVSGVLGTKKGGLQRLTHVLVETQSGRVAIAARQFIDCTGTGDLATHASLICQPRIQGNFGSPQPMSLYFRLGGVNTDQLTLLMAHDGVKYANPELREILQEEVAAGRLRNFGGPWTVHGSTIRPGEVSVNVTRIGGDATDPKVFSKAEITLREEIYTIINIFRHRHPAFVQCYLIETAAQVGIRETRSIDGLYTMTVEDLLEPCDFPDTIAKGGHPIDIHQSGNSQQDARFITRPYSIPYRSIVPKNSENIMVAGAILSASKEAFGSIRVQAQCMAMGQAAGTASALCLQKDIPVCELNGAELRDKLRADGALV